MEFHIAESALADLQSIRDYYQAEAAPYAAEKLIRHIVEKFALLKSHPDIGRVVPEFYLPYIKEIIFPPFRLVYFRQQNALTLIRVWRSERLLVLPDLK